MLSRVFFSSSYRRPVSFAVPISETKALRYKTPALCFDRIILTPSPPPLCSAVFVSYNMVMPLDSPQPSFVIPPSANIEDTPEETPEEIVLNV